jgi:single-strand DNA-binding protein
MAMLNDAQISLTGYVATQPVTRLVKEGVTNVSMRVAWTPRRQDRATGEWVDGNTSYATVICWRKLATNVAICLRKGDPVMIKGRLSVRSYEDKEGRPRTSVEVDATSVGHDLNRGVATFQRIRPQTGMTASEFAAAQNASSGGEGTDGAGSNGQAADGAASIGGGFGSEDRALTFAGSGEGGQQVPDEPASFFDESAISPGTESEEAAAAA